MTKRRERPEQLWLEGVSSVPVSLIPPRLESIRKVSASKLRTALGPTLDHVRKNKEILLMTRNNRTVGLIIPPELIAIIEGYRTQVRLAVANVQMSDILSRIEYRDENFIIDRVGQVLAIMGPLRIFDAMDAARTRAIKIRTPEGGTSG